MFAELLAERVVKHRRTRPYRWVNDYNHHRNHTAIDGPPASRVHNVCGYYTGTVDG